jgi:hypothetical protein
VWKLCRAGRGTYCRPETIGVGETRSGAAKRWRRRRHAGRRLPGLLTRAVRRWLTTRSGPVSSSHMSHIIFSLFHPSTNGVLHLSSVLHKTDHSYESTAIHHQCPHRLIRALVRSCFGSFISDGGINHGSPIIAAAVTVADGRDLISLPPSPVGRRLVPPKIGIVRDRTGAVRFQRTR